MEYQKACVWLNGLWIMRSQLPSVFLQAKYTLDETDEIKQSERLWSSYCNILSMRRIYRHMLVMSICCNMLVIRSIYYNMLVISTNGYWFHPARTCTISHWFISLCIWYTEPLPYASQNRESEEPFHQWWPPLRPCHRSTVLWKPLKFCKPKKLFCPAQKARACFSVSYSLKC